MDTTQQAVMLQPPALKAIINLSSYFLQSVEYEPISGSFLLIGYDPEKEQVVKTYFSKDDYNAIAGTKLLFESKIEDDGE